MEADTTSLDAAVESGDWVRMGHVLKPAMFEDQPGMPGPSEIVAEGIGVVRLDASTLLPESLQQRMPIVLGESYVSTFDHDRAEPVIGGIVQLRVQDEATGALQFETWVLGIRIMGEMQGQASDMAHAQAGIFNRVELLTATRVFAGVEHDAKLAGTSELGVISVQLEGDLQPDAGVQHRLIGVDVVRGTEVWFKEYGSAEYGEGEARYLYTVVGDDCVLKVDIYWVGSGVVRDSTTEMITGVDTLSSICERR